MSEIKNYVKIVGASFTKAVIIWAVGIVICMLTFFVALYQAGIIWELHGPHGQVGAHAGIAAVIPLLAILFTHDPLAGLLLIGSIPLISFYVILGNGMLIRNTIYRLWQDKAREMIINRVKQVSEMAVQRTNRWDDVINAAVAKIELFKANKDHPDTNRLKRRMIRYLFKKIKLSEVDLKQSKEEFPNTVAQRIVDYISELTQPGWRTFFLLISIQFLLMIISFFV